MQKDLGKVGKWAAENEIKINPSKYKALYFARPRVKNPLNYTLGDQLIPKASSCKYLRITLRSDLNWVDHVNYMTKKAWKELHFIMHILKRGKVVSSI